MMTADELTENIVDSTESHEGFRNIVPDLLKELMEGPKSNIKVFFNVLSTVLKSEDESAINKFYGLYLILKACEGKPTKAFLDEMSSKEDLISNIFQTAQFDAKKKSDALDKGKTYFTSTPTSDSEGFIGINYVRLATEVIIYCGTHHGSEDMTEPSYNFWFKMESLRKRTTFPTTHWFMGKDYNTNEEIAYWNFHSKYPTSEASNVSSTIQPASGIKPNLYQSELKGLVNEQQPILKSPSHSQQASMSKNLGVSTQYGGSANPPRTNAFERSNDAKTVKSKNDLSNVSAGLSSSIFEDKSIDGKKTLGMRMAEMGVFTGEKRDRSKSPTAASARRDKTPEARRDKTPEGAKTQDIRNFFSDREKAERQAKPIPSNAWQTSEPSSIQTIGSTNDPFARVPPETRGREKQPSYSAVDRPMNEERVKATGNIRKEPSPYRSDGMGWKGYDTANQKLESPVKVQEQRPMTPTRGQQGFDYNRVESKNFGTSDIGSDNAIKEQYRAAMIDNENIKKECAFLKGEIEKYKKDLYMKTMKEEDLVRENRNLKAELQTSGESMQRNNQSEALLKENALLKSKFGEYERRIIEMNNSLTYLANENKQLKETLLEKERELEDSRDVPVRHVVYPGSTPFGQGAGGPTPFNQGAGGPAMSISNSFVQSSPGNSFVPDSYQSRVYNTTSQNIEDYRSRQYTEGMYSGETGRRTPEKGLYFYGEGEQNAASKKKNIFEKVNYEKPPLVLSKENPYY